MLCDSPVLCRAALGCAAPLPAHKEKHKSERIIENILYFRSILSEYKSASEKD